MQARNIKIENKKSLRKIISKSKFTNNGLYFDQY